MASHPRTVKLIFFAYLTILFQLQRLCLYGIEWDENLIMRRKEFLNK
jgi:hypothetical protein